MPQDISKHSFEGGMNKDLSKSKIQPNQYTDAKNITVSLNEENNLISLTNIKGNSKQFTIPYITTSRSSGAFLDWKNRDDDTTITSFAFADIEITKSEVDANSQDFRIVGYTTIRNLLVLLLRPKTDVNGLSIICTIDLDDINDQEQPVLKYIGKLNFPLSPIDVEGNYESSTIQKIYWADGTNELGHFNIADSEGYKLNSDKLLMNSDINISNITLISTSNSGEFDSGKVQYSYQYYDVNGGVSALATPTALLDVSDGDFKGNESTDKVYKAFTLSFSGDLNWERVKIFRIQYTTNTNTAQIYVVKDTEVVSTITFTDTGSTLLPTESIDLLQSTLLTSVIPKNIKSKDNRLIIGNYQETTYNPTYDTRAYRFPASNVETTIEDESANTYTIDSTSNFNITEVNATPITPYAVPNNADAINPDTYLDSMDITTKRMYKANSSGTSGLGASGINVTVGFTSESISIDTDSTTVQSLVYSSNDNVGSAINFDKHSWKRDEIYRLAVILINNAGLRSSPRWICDLRIPSSVEYPIVTESSGEISASYVYPTFTFNNLPDDCVGVEVVKVERTDNNKTCLSQGVIMPTTKNWSSDTYHPILSNSINLFSTELLGFDFYELDRITNLQQSGVVIGDIIFVNESYVGFNGEPFIGYWKCTSNPGATNIGVGSSIGVPDNIEDYCIKVYRADSPNATADANMVLYQIGQILNSGFNSAETALNGKHMHQYGYLYKNLINYFSPEISINKTINVGTDNYFKVSHYEIMDGKHYSQEIITNGLTEIGNSALANEGSPSVNGVDYGVAEVFIFAKGQSVTTPTIIPQVTIDIEKSQIFKPDDVASLQGTENFSISNTYITDFNGRCGTSLFAEIEEVTLDEVDNSVIIFDYKSPYVVQYGGKGYSSRSNNTYIPASIYQIKTGSTATITAKLGDTYISQWNSLPNYYRAGSLCRTYSSLNYLETDININKPLDTTVASYPENGIAKKVSFIKDNWREFESDGSNRNYKYNPVYNLENKFITSISDFSVDNTTIFYENQFKISELKFNNEITDSWLQFLTNNYLDVDGKYGPINSINEVNDTIIFFQDDAVGQLSINPKYASATSEGSLIVGTGGILDDYKYISTTHGCKNRESILRTPKGLYYFDIQNKKLRMLGDEQSPLSDIKGLHSYLKDNVNSVGNNPIQANGITAGYDYSTNKAYFTFHTNNPFTISYDESLNIIESFIDCNPLLWISTRQGIYSTMSEADYNTNLKADGFYQFGTGQYGRFFATLYPSYITFIENKNPDVVKILNNIEYFNEVTNNSEEDTTNTFDYLQVWNNYQDTTELPLTYPNRIHIYDRKWRLPIPRNYKPYNPTILESIGNTLSSGVYVLHPTTFYLYKTLQAITSYDLPSNNSLDQDKFLRVKTRLDRIRDFASFIKLKFTNDGSDKLISHDILVKFDY